MEIKEDDQQSNTIKGEDQQLNVEGKQSTKEVQNQHDWKGKIESAKESQVCIKSADISNQIQSREKINN